MINFCPKCHSIINDGAVFCNNCGVNILDFKEIKEPIQAPQQTSANNIEENIPNVQNFNNNTYPQGNNVTQNNPSIKLPKLQRYPFSTIAAFFILLGVAAIIYGFFRSRFGVYRSVFSYFRCVCRFNRLYPSKDRFHIKRRYYYKKAKTKIKPKYLNFGFLYKILNNPMHFNIKSN